MLKRALLLLAIAGGLVWWYERGQGLEDASVKQVSTSAPQAAPRVLKGAAVRPAGGWGPKAWSVLGGKLVPGRSLRERFDSYLPLGKGVTMVEVRAALAKDAQADLGPANSAQVLALWDRYARLQNHDWQHPFNGSDPKGWQATLNEQHRVRRQLLGVEWAEAFFGDDEAALQRRIAGLVATPRKPPAPKLNDLLASAPTSAALASRASAVSGDWSARADKARLEWAQLTQDGSLDEGQRLIRIRQYLQQHFDGPEGARLARELQLP
jgi:hypothetical protein